MLSAIQQGMKRSLSVESFAEPEGSGGSGLGISKRLRAGVRRHVFDKDAQMHTKYVLQDKVERPQFVKKIALSYVISAALIAVLCLTGQIIVQVYESRTHTDGRYVNTAGKQRYLSQAITKASLAVERANASADAASSLHFQSQLQSSLQQWYTAQYGLLYGDGSLKLSGSKDGTVRRLFAQVDPNFQAMYAAGAEILHEVSGKSFQDLALVPPQTVTNVVGVSENVDVLTAHEDQFLLLMNEIVGRFQDLGEKHVQTLLIITWIFAGLIILTLVLEGWFLVRPVLTRMHLLVSERFDLLHASLEAEAGARGVSILMVGYVSHEMREPLGSVMRNLKYLFGQLKQMAIIHGKPEGGALHEACKSAMETLRQSMSSCRLLATVIDDIADMRKLEAGMLTLFTNPVDVAECMRHAAGMMQPKLGVTLRNEIDPRVGGKRYNLDRHRLEQLLVNLISNAVKFSREGTVVVRVLPWEDRGLRFEVIDRGIGMTAEASAKVFMPFNETPHDKANFQGGTGLGLYICKLLADLMGGTIGVSSEVGHGSTFWFHLPTSEVVDHAFSSAENTPREPSVINGFTTNGVLPEGREGEIDDDERDEDEKELPPLMESPMHVETTVSGPGHVHHGGVSITSILGHVTKPPFDQDHLSPRSRGGGSLKGGSKFWSLSGASPRRGSSYHGGNSYRGEGSYRGGARRGSSVHGGSVYRGGGTHLTIDIEGLSQRGARGAPSPLGNGGPLVRTSSGTSTPLLAEQGETFLYHGRPVRPPEAEVKSLEIDTGEGVTRGSRAGRESARGGNLFLKLQEKMQGGDEGQRKAPNDVSEMV